MISCLQQILRSVTAWVLIAVFLAPCSLMAETSHLVSPADLQRSLVNASQTRQHNLETVQSFLSSERATQALTAVHMDPERVKTAVASLSDQELARVAARAQKAQVDFAAGTLSDRDLIIILVAIAALILIIVAVR
jgi:hypothetical protein